MSQVSPAELSIRKLNRSELQAMLRPTESELSRRFITDPELYRLELERIFARCWIFVAHESEIPNPNDFVTRSIGEDPVIVIRDEGSRVRVLLNSCRHRGAMLTRAPAGNARHFACSYHGWTYNSSGELFGIPLRKLWEGVIDPSKCGLVAAPHVEAYRGLIFASWDPQAPTLKDYLGGMAWYLDLVFGRNDQGLEVVSPPQQWIVDVNWKVAFGNFIGDSYHLMTAHKLIYGQSDAKVRPGDGYQVHMNNGHGVGLKALADEPMRSFGLQPEELLGELERNLSPDQLAVLRPMRNIHGAVFPSLGFFESSLKLGANQQMISVLSLRQLQPRGPNRFEFLSWCLVPKAAAAWRKEAARKLHVTAFGPAGTVDQDDTAAWKAITDGCRGVISQGATFQYGLALGKHEPVANWPGPGVAYPTAMTEANERAFIDRWFDLMSQG